jgi:hypothetical protein
MLLLNVHQPARVMHMNEEPDRSTVQAVLRNLNDAQRWLDREPELGVAAARLAHVISDVEDWAAEAILRSEGQPRPTA